MHAESSDGFASVGTILPKEKAALLPGGLFASAWRFLRGEQGSTHALCSAVVRKRVMRRHGVADSENVGLVRLGSAESVDSREVAMHDFLVGLVFVAMVMTPCVVALMTRLDDGSSKYDR
jgi:hypothetical protein